MKKSIRKALCTVIAGSVMFAIFTTGCGTFVQDTEAASAGTAGALQTQSGIVPQIIEGTMESAANSSCYGNLLYVNGGYYTMTENGPEPVELQNLTTTVELYGSWEVDIDYAVIDGVLCFRDLNSSNDVDAGLAAAYPVEGSSDTVLLMVSRNGIDLHNNEKSFDYKFLYNVVTGEITDPLSRVTELDSHGTVSQVLFNSDFSYAIVSVESEPRLPEELQTVTVTGEHQSYLCDLSTGEMTAVADLVAPHLENLGLSAEELAELGICFFSDNDNILLYDVRFFHNAYGDWDWRYWLFSCNVETGALNYSIENVTMTPYTTGTFDYSFPYVLIWNYVLDSRTGTEYDLPMSIAQLMAMPYDEEGSRAVLCTSEGGIYLVDDTQLAWVKLSDHMEMPEGEILSLQLVTDDWLCITTPERVCCYHIPDDLPMTPLTER